MDEFKLGDREFVELKNLLKIMGVFESGGETMKSISEGLDAGEAVELVDEI